MEIQELHWNFTNNIFCFTSLSLYVAGKWWFPDVLHCQDVEADCLDILIICSTGI